MSDVFPYPIAKLVPLKLREDSPENEQVYLDYLGVTFSDVFVCLGEVGDCGHYIIMKLSSLTGNEILPGFFHIERFRPADEEEEL